MSNNFDLTVVIATTAEKKRAQKLENAINSVLLQKDCKFEIIVVVNGQRFDPEIRADLEENTHINSVYRDEGSYPKALSFGRSLVETPYFCFLDDDDELLPGSLSARHIVFEKNQAIDVVVGNGIRDRYKEKTIECHPEIVTYQADPLGELLKPDGIWLGSCAGMYKTSSITVDFFSDYAAYGEWTYLAYKLSLSKKIQFIPNKCFKINMHNESLSHSKEYLFGLYEMHNRVLQLSLPKYARKAVLLKKSNIEHCIAEYYLELGFIKKGWLYHLKSMNNIQDFFKYCAFTRYFLIRKR